MEQGPTSQGNWVGVHSPLERLGGASWIACPTASHTQIVRDGNRLFSLVEGGLECPYRAHRIARLQGLDPRLQPTHLRYFFRTRRTAASVTTLGMFLLRASAMRSFFCMDDTSPTARLTGVFGLFTSATFTG